MNSSSSKNSSGSRGGRKGKVYKGEDFCPRASPKPGQKGNLLSRVLARPGTKSLVPAGRAKSGPFVPARGWNQDKRSPDCCTRDFFSTFINNSYIYIYYFVFSKEGPQYVNNHFIK